MIPTRPSSGRLLGAGRRVAVAALATGALLGPMAGAHAAYSAPPPLTATTTVSAAGTGYLPVRLTEPMKIDLLATPQITVSDPSAFVALVLVQVPSEGPASGPMLELTALPSGQQTVYRYGCGGAPDDGERTPFCVTGALPAGDYRLYVVATGPEQVHVELPAPAGTQTLAAAIPAVSHSVLASSPGVGGTLVAPVVTAGGQFSFPHRFGLLIDTDWVRSSNVAARTAESCFYGETTLDTLAEPAPAYVCPGGTSGGINDLEYRPGDDRADGGYAAALAPGIFGMKETDTYVGQVEDAVIRLIWLDWG